MFFKLKQKFALVPASSELSLTTYAEEESSLDNAFVRFPALRRATRPEATLEYTLPAQSESREVVRLPKGYHHLSVCSGFAWISYRTKDYLVGSGAEMRFGNDSQDAVVSSAGSEPLHFQVRL